MYNTLRELHRKFCKVPPMPELERQYEKAFRESMRWLGKPERKLLLKAIDIKGLMMEDAVFDSFVCGVRLALGLTTELQHYEEERPEFPLAVLRAMKGEKDED